ncbi:MAG: hypothetical protein HY587_03590 [Candidatus Omnitrophica bacterium]|nr:hypothetical protein [Candidatus Omnitrophota bacterium]
MADHFEGNAKNDVLRNMGSYGLLMGYINNKLNLVRMLIEYPNVERPADTVTKAQEWIRDICGHFCFDKKTEFYYSRLIEILGNRPNISAKEKLEGLACIDGILLPFYKELPFHDELREVGRRPAKEVLGSHEGQEKSPHK